MSGQFRENWKRLTGQLPTSKSATEDADITRVADASPGGAGTWSKILSGLISTGQAITSVGTAVAGREYILVALNSPNSGANFSSGDEDELIALSTGGTQIPIIDTGSLPSQSDPSDPDAERDEVIAFIVGSTGQVQASSRSVGNGAFTIVNLNMDDGDITTQHVNGNGTNGIYAVFEKS